MTERHLLSIDRSTRWMKESSKLSHICLSHHTAEPGAVITQSPDVILESWRQPCDSLLVLVSLSRPNTTTKNRSGVGPLGDAQAAVNPAWRTFAAS